MTPEAVEERARCLQIIRGAVQSYFNTEVPYEVTSIMQLIDRAIREGEADPRTAITLAAVELVEEA